MYSRDAFSRIADGRSERDAAAAPSLEERTRPASRGVASARSGPMPISTLHSIAMLGNHLPRRCGIATFTGDLADALHEERPDLDCFVLAMNEPGKAHAYPERVRWALGAEDLGAYRRAADYVHAEGVDVVSLQHEYGIFGGSAGAHVLSFVRSVGIPVVSTLHTVLTHPNAAQRAAMDELTRLSTRIIVMSAEGAALLQSVHGVPPEKIDLIPHGIVPAPRIADAKEQLGLEGAAVLFTFGLLSPDKGIEHVIDALPTILTHHPNAVYVLVGATHPHIQAREGEAYRSMLMARAAALGVSHALRVYDRFVRPDELALFMAAADVYVTPYLKPEQSTSGTLAYAVGAGKAVISTPYSHARELLAEGRGLFVPWRDGAAIAHEVSRVLEDPSLRAGLELRALTHGDAMRWPAVARGYLRSFERAQRTFARHPSERPMSRLRAWNAPLPALELSHLAVLTDSTGLLQHATFDVPRYEDGYCVDDNARGLLLATQLLEGASEDPTALRSLATRYLAFLAHAFVPSRGRFHNFMSYSRAWTDETGSEDSHGRALWALGTVMGQTPQVGRHAVPSRGSRALAESLFFGALEAATSFTSPRAWAYVLLGVHAARVVVAGERRVDHVERALSERLFDLFVRTSTPEWPFFEHRLTYCNARLSQAMLVSKENPAMRDAGLVSLRWLAQIQTSAEGYFRPVGSEGFYERGGSMALFDQQPVEACSMVSACLTAHRLTHDPFWQAEAMRAYEWFLGRNHLALSLIDEETGGCRDGLHQTRANENQGAESTLSHLMALAELRRALRPLRGSRRAAVGGVS